MGASVIGGCCGTTPEHIRAMKDACRGLQPLPAAEKEYTVVSSYGKSVFLGNRTEERHGSKIIGERINPTGKKRFKQALKEHDLDYILREAITQQDNGAHILDVNVGLPDIDEPALMEEAVQEIQSVVNLPLQIDTVDIQAMEHLSHAIIPFASFEKDKKKQIKLSDAPAESVLTFTCDEIVSILELVKFWSSDLDEKELDIVYNIEVPLTFVLADMEYDGVSVDEMYLAQLTVSMNLELSHIEEKIFKLAGCNFNINSPRQVGEVLFDKMGIKAKKKRGKANYSTNAAVLEELAEEYEIAQLILDYRKYAKLKSTYTEALPALIDIKDRRIHTTYNQTVTATGRLSSSNPNLQNIPVRTEEGNKIRNAFVPEDKENSLILSADYSQIELRLLAHITQDKHLLEAFNSGIDVHTLTASKVFDVPVEQVTKDMRYKSKAVNFGIIYGQSKYGLAKALGISNAEAEDFINKYFATYPRVKAYMEGTVKEAEEKGYVQTIFGRKRYLSSELSSSNAMIREFAKRAAINQPMQGSAADLMKIAMIEFSRKLKENNLKSKMIIQVHDELVVEVLKSELEDVKRLVKEAMELNQPLSVPLVIDISVGESWKEQ